MNGLWSRPLLPWLHGMRPNSVVQITIVSSSRPRAFRSLISAAAGWSMPAAMSPWSLARSSWLSQLRRGKAVVGAAPDLHEAHAALQQPPGDEAVRPKSSVDLVVEAVELLRRLRLAGDVEHLGRAQLQTRGQSRRRRCGRRAASRLRAWPGAPVQLSQQRRAFRVSLSGVMNFAASGGNRSKIGFGPAGADHRALVRRGQEAGAPVGRAVGGEAARVGQDDERRQVVGQAAQAVADPRAHAGEARQHEAGVLHERRRAVDVRLRDHRVDEGDVVDARAEVRHQAR